MTADADISLSEIESRLNREGFTLNYFPTSGRGVLLTEALSERIPNVYSQAYGGIEDLCIQICLAQPDGTIFRNVMAPRSATGPCLKNLAIGSGEGLGIPIQASLKIFHKPESTQVAGILFSVDPSKEFYLHSLKKSGIRLPLLLELSAKNISEVLEDAPKGAPVLALAAWGDRKLVDSTMNFLRDLAFLKKGEWLDVEQVKMQNFWLEVMHKQATKERQKKINRAKETTPSTHLDLMRIIQEIQ